MASLIEQIINDIEAIPIEPGGSLTLAASDFDLPFMTAFFNDVLLQDSLVLQDAVKNATGNTAITLNGKSGLFGYINLALEISFYEEDEQVKAKVYAVFPATYNPVLPVINWMQAADLSFTKILYEENTVVDFRFDFSICSSSYRDVSLPVLLQNSGAADWEINLTGNDNKAITIDQLVALLAGQSVDDFLPAQLVNILAGLSLNNLSTRYNVELHTINFFSIGIGVTNGWTIVEDAVVLLPGLQINLSLFKFTEKSNWLTSASVLGTFVLGGVNVPVYLGAIMGSTTTWTFGLQPDTTVTLPSFSDLLGLAGGQVFLNSLPSGLSEIPEIIVNTLAVEFDATKNVLTRLAFGVNTGSSWPIIEGYFSIAKIYIAFDTRDVNNPLTRNIYGTLNGLFEVGTGNLLMCSIDKTEDNPDWMVTAGLPPGKTLSLTAIALQLFEGKVTVPASIPDFKFSTLLITVVPSKQSFQFEARSTDVWKITESISVDAFDLVFSRNPDDAENPIQGNVSTTLNIASVGVFLSASINSTTDGGWQFSGKTKPGDPIVIGDVIAYVVQKFGVDQPPAWIRTISLQDLSVAFNSATKDFSFGATAKIKFTSTELAIQVGFSLQHEDAGKYKNVLSGIITIQHIDGGASEFKIDFETGTDNTKLTAAWKAKDASEYLQFADLLNAFGFNAPSIPEGLDLALSAATIIYDFTNSSLALSIQSANYGKAVFIAMRNPADQQWVYFFGLASDLVINLANLPIIDKLTFIDAGKLEITAIDVNFVSTATSAALAVLLNQQIKALLPDEKNIPALPAEGMDGTVSFSMTVNIGGTLYPVNLVLGGSDNDQALVTLDSGEEVKTKWFNIQKNFGPLYFDKIGLGYKDSRIYVMVNVTATASGLSLALNGFGISSPVTTFEISFTISGISITYNNGPILISGGLMGSFSPVNLYGDILIKTSALAIGGIGGYTELEGKPSMFLYAVLNFPIGGPPFFFITGLSAGFGFNRKLLIPGIEGVSTFPFVVWAMPGSGAPVPDPTKDLAAQVNSVLADIENKGIVAPEVGSSWLAAGICFTSFEMVNSFVLVTVIFGTRFEIDLLGLSRIVIPPGSGGSTGIPPVAFAELAIKASYVDGTGLISIEGQLTENSYVLSRSCHLTGGFAFYFWFSGDHEGDFVISLGGYNPNYDVPRNYPKVPRLGANWKVDGNLLISGSLYFALTSNAVMAGGLLEAVWSSGGIRAWFILQADFLIMWKPFHYDIVANTDIGASFTINLLFTKKTITIHVGVGLHVWGPEFSGKAKIKVAIISFTISFGAGDTNIQKSISWDEFIGEMLPQKAGSNRTLTGNANPDICKIKVTNGLLQQLSDVEGELNWVVNSSQLEIVTESIIPSKDYDIKNSLAPQIQIVHRNLAKAASANTDFGVRPVGLASADFQSKHIVQITSSSGDAYTFHAEPVFKNIPKGLWQKISFNRSGNPDVGDPLNDTTLTNVLTGFSLKPFIETPATALTVLMQYLQYNVNPPQQHFSWVNTYIPGDDDFQGETVPGTIMDTAAQQNRSMLIAAIPDLGFDIYSNVDVVTLADPSTYYLLAAPLLRLLGEEKTTV